MNNKIKYLVMDVDGTLTDGKIYIGNEGELFKAFSVKDGYGIHNLLMPTGIIPVIITARNSTILEKRCAELGITELYQGVKNKIEVLDSILSAAGCNYSNVAYIGDDLNDLSCMEPIMKNDGLVGCPADAVEDVVKVSGFVGKKNGGDGAVREFIEFILK